MSIADNRLASIIERREYTHLAEEINQHLKSGSWHSFIDAIERISRMPEAVVGWGIPLRKGIIRDALYEVLDLSPMIGLDGNFLNLFKSLDGRSLNTLRTEAQHAAFNYLSEQVRNGNTFFLDTSAMEASDLVVLVPDVVEARREQVLNLERNVHLADVCSTYYGFMLLTYGSLANDIGGMPEAAIGSFEDLASQLGRELRVGNESLHHSTTAFGHVSEYTRELLWSLLDLCIANHNGQVRAADALGQLGDSRAIGLLHLRLESSTDRRVRLAIITALGRIGHPESFSVLHGIMHRQDQRHEQLHYRWSQDQRAAATAMGGIRHPEAERVLQDNMNNPSYPVEAFGLSRNGGYIDVILARVRNSRSRHRSEVISQLGALKSLGPEGVEIVETLYQRHLSERGNISGIIRLMSSISGFRWADNEIGTIAARLDGESGTEDILRAVTEDRQLLSDPRIRQSIQSLLNRDTQTPSQSRLRRIIKDSGFDADQLAD
jgi:hypothetical protein